MQNCVKGNVFIGCIMKKSFDFVAICDVGLNKVNTWREEITPGVAEVIDDDNFMSTFKKEACDCAADVPGTACDHDLHKKIIPFPAN